MRAHESKLSGTHGQSGGVTTPITTHPAQQHTEVVVTDAGTNPDIATLSIAMQSDMQNLFSDPAAFIHRTVIKCMDILPRLVERLPLEF